MRERITLSIPTQTTMKALRGASEVSLYRTAMRDIFEIDFAGF
jgi:hypothetical protein